MSIVELEREFAATLIDKRAEEDVLEDVLAVMGREVEDLWKDVNRN